MNRPGDVEIEPFLPRGRSRYAACLCDELECPLQLRIVLALETERCECEICGEILGLELERGLDLGLSLV
jgi:hypothetical protein